MKTPIFRTHREAVIVETQTRITLPSTSVATNLVLLEDTVSCCHSYTYNSMPSIVLCHPNNPRFAAQQPVKRMDSGRSVGRYVSNQHRGERIVHGLE